MDFLVSDLVHIIEKNTIDEVDGNNKVVKVRINAKTDKFKSKNSVKPLLAKSQLFVRSFKLGFLILGARLTLTELKQTFINHQFFIIFIRNIIFILKLMYLAMLLVEFSIS